MSEINDVFEHYENVAKGIFSELEDVMISRDRDGLKEVKRKLNLLHEESLKALLDAVFESFLEKDKDLFFCIDKINCDVKICDVATTVNVFVKSFMVIPQEIKELTEEGITNIVMDDAMKDDKELRLSIIWNNE